MRFDSLLKLFETRQRAWDDDRHRWWAGEVTVIDDDVIEVTVLNGDHPLHPWEAETICVPLDSEFIQPPRAPTP